MNFSRLDWSRWRRRAAIAVLTGWSDAARIFTIPLAMVSVVLLAVFFVRFDITTIRDFYWIGAHAHYLRFVNTIAAFALLWVGIIPIAAFLIRAATGPKVRLIEITASAHTRFVYGSLVLVATSLLAATLPLLTTAGFAWWFTGLLPKFVAYSGLMLLIGTGIAAWFRKRALEQFLELEIGILPEYIPHPDVIYLATGYLSPRIDYIENRMRLWKRVEEYLGLPNPKLSEYREKGLIPGSLLRDAVGEFQKSGKWRGIEGLREDLARSMRLGGAVPADRVAVCSSATEGCSLVLTGLARRVKNEKFVILRSGSEYDTIENLLKQEEKRNANTTGKKVALYEGEVWRGSDQIVKEIVQEVKNALADNGYCLLLISQIVSEWGTIMPIQKLHATLCELDGATDRLFFVVDGAHSIGQIPIDIGSFPRAIFLWSGHKWMYGPHGTGGIAFGEEVSDELIKDIASSGQMREPFVFSERWTGQRWAATTRQWAGIDTSRFVGLAAAMDLHRILWRHEGKVPDEWTRKAERTLIVRNDLVARLKYHLAKSRSPCRLLFPDDGSMNDSETQHAVAPGVILLDSNYPEAERGRYHEEVVRRLFDRRISCNILELTRRIRLCVTPFLTSDQVEVVARGVAAASTSLHAN